MIDGFFTILDIRETWEPIILKVNSLFDSERFQFPDALALLGNKISDNPLASIITLLILIVLPYTLFKAKKSNTQAKEQNELLMKEMKDFELKNPLIDLQENFKDSSFDNAPPAGYGQDVLELNLEDEVPDLSIKEDNLLQDLESPSFTKQLTLDQEVEDDFLATAPMDPQRDTDDENSESSPLAEANFDETEASQPKSSVEDEEYASHDVDDLQTRMEQAIKKLRQNYPSAVKTEKTASGESSTDSVPSVLETAENPPNVTQQEQDSSINPNLKPTETDSPAPNKTTDDEYQESLESFLFLKNPNKPK